MREAYERYQDEHYFRFCRRDNCPDARRKAEHCRLRRQDYESPFLACPPFDARTSYVSSTPQEAPICIVNRYMLKLISTVMAHVYQLCLLLNEPYASNALTTVTCETFLSRGWQGHFIRSFCQPAHQSGSAPGPLISFDAQPLAPSNLAQTYRLVIPVDNETVIGQRDLHLSRVYNSEMVFNLDFLGSLQGPGFVTSLI